MRDLSKQLQTFFASDLKRVSPLWLVAGAAGAAIGVAVGDPVWAQTALGSIMAGLSLNITSSLIYDIVKPELGDESREQAIVNGLKQGDAQVVRLTVETLIAVIGSVTTALPAGQREQLIGQIAEGLNSIGGVAQKIAPNYAEALRQRQGEWSKYQEDMRRTIVTVHQNMEAIDGGTLYDNSQINTSSNASSNQSMISKGKGSNIFNSQQISGRDDAPRLAQNKQKDGQEKSSEVIDILTRRLELLEQQRAYKGIDAPPQTIMEIQDIRKRLEDV